MFYVFVQRFDETDNLGNFLETKHGLKHASNQLVSRSVINFSHGGESQTALGWPMRDTWNLHRSCVKADEE
jgi:hypothetical protein